MEIMEKTGWKKSRILIAAVFVATLVTVLVLNFAAFQVNVVNACVGANARTNGFLTPEEDYRQYFRPASPDLAYVEVRLATYTDETANGQLVFSLLDQTGSKLTTSTVNIADLKDDEFCRFPVNMTLDTEKNYSFTLRPVGNAYEKSPTVWVSAVSGTEELRLSIPDKPTSSLYQSHAQYAYTITDYRAFALCVALLVAGGILIAIPFRFSEKQKAMAGRIAVVLSPVAMFFIVEALNDNSAFKKITPAYILNYMAYILIYLVLFAVTNRIRISMIAANTVLYVLALINYFKLQFRGEPIQPWDFFAAGTAMNVAGNYTFSLSAILLVTICAFLLLTIALTHVDLSMKRIRTRVLTGALSAALSALMVFALFGTDRYAIAAFSFMQRIGIVNNVWNQPSNYAKNGLVVALTMNAQYMNVDTPDGYSPEEIARIKSLIELAPVSETEISVPTSSGTTPFGETTAETGISGATTDVTDTNGTAPTEILPSETTAATETASTVTVDEVPATKTPVRPNVIAIMCESFADLQAVGDFATNMPVTPFIDSMATDVIKGTAYVSTYGGGTANSEFEFLTGNSMAFLPTGSIPYQQFIDQKTGSLAWTLKEFGYQTIAVHPFDASGWNRPSVYENLGFDQFLSFTDFTDPLMMRSYVSDEASYDKLIELYEAKPEGQPIFLFNVTMQNHGGYVPKNDNFEAEITLSGFDVSYPETEEYLSLAHASDEALSGLVSYFAAQEEPTVIVFFGDHLPKLKDAFYSDILGKDLASLSSEEMLAMYQTPFLVWANYDIPETNIEKMSLNYLSTLVLEMTGLPLPDYNVFLSDLFGSYPVVNSMAVISSEGTVYSNTDAVRDPELLKRYAMLSYNNLFDKNGRDATIFDSTCPSAQANIVMFAGEPNIANPAPEETIDNPFSVAGVVPADYPLP